MNAKVPSSAEAANVDNAGLNHPIESYLKAAEEGFIAAQYLVGLAHLEGCGMEKERLLRLLLAENG